ncbi:aTP phosphoribosyltransferase regulatory subunit [Coprococcus sp. CAG:782]|uniref:ATP phosphoribosyltransferase regulatory subunit n=1 Tax=Coprococcus sp. OM04-5BH TaxID=2293093 RepID=UPI000338ED3E|nr:ATP phosphoribosyltransferase regulatory subunit [Coprococcus sp. OM04-5BH]RHV32530.1 ATP phosphoribosyltransferase regulatory subunit [Coprococcus sp. OM04-5BH]CCY53364.1 aTP phosphoribosyltransferase regulatory subunit [Coprococcus sp. CAG:782]
MQDKLLQTPDGVRDTYGTECEKKRNLLAKLHHVLKLYSYHDIETPTFEFFDIFNRDKGSVPSNEMYKFFDRDNNTLVLRPDITPSIARCVAKYYADEDFPVRLCYTGNTYINTLKLQGKLKETTQIGAELINDDSTAADAEIISTVIDCFKEIGIKDFQIEIGSMDYFVGLVKESGISEETAVRIKEYINIKNFFGLSEYLKELNVPDNIKEAFLAFDSLFGGEEMIDRAISYVANDMSVQACERLRRIYKALSYYGYETNIGFDLSMLDGYNYYTGIIFRGYTYGTGDAIVTGGRYNNLLKQFGKDAPSIGFAFKVDELMNAMNRQDIEIPVERTDSIVLYEIENQEAAIAFAMKKRADGRSVELIRKSTRKSLEEYVEYGRRENFESLIFVEENNRTQVFDLSQNN